MSQLGPTAPPSEYTDPEPHPVVLLKWARLELLDIETTVVRIRGRVENVISSLETQLEKERMGGDNG